jgi:hypothetical protein
MPGSGVDATCLCAALDRHSLCSILTAKISTNPSLNHARTNLDKAHTVIPPTHCCARVSFCITVALTNFLVFVIWSVVYLSGRGPAPTTGVYLPNLVDVTQLVAGRSFSDLYDCTQSEAFNFDLEFQASQDKSRSIVSKRTCSTKTFQTYYDTCWDKQTLLDACDATKTTVNAGMQCNSRALRNSIRCGKQKCQQSMLNVYICLSRATNDTFPSYNMANQCKLPPKSKKSFQQNVAVQMLRNDSNTWLTKDEHNALLVTRFCAKEKCGALRNRVLIQTATTIAFTFLFETLFEKGINTCSRRLCTPVQFAAMFTCVDALLLFLGGFIVNNMVDAEYERFRARATQRCLYVPVTSLKLKAIQQFLPILGMTWAVNLMVLLVQGWLARRKDLKVGGDGEAGGAREVGDGGEAGGGEGGGDQEMMENPMKK